MIITLTNADFKSASANVPDALLPTLLPVIGQVAHAWLMTVDTLPTGDPFSAERNLNDENEAELWIRDCAARWRGSYSYH